MKCDLKLDFLTFNQPNNQWRVKILNEWVILTIELCYLGPVLLQSFWFSTGILRCFEYYCKWSSLFIKTSVTRNSTMDDQACRSWRRRPQTSDRTSSEPHFEASSYSVLRWRDLRAFPFLFLKKRHPSFLHEATQTRGPEVCLSCGAGLRTDGGSEWAAERV